MPDPVILVVYWIVSPIQAAGYKVRIPTLALLLYLPSAYMFCFIINDF